MVLALRYKDLEKLINFDGILASRLFFGMLRMPESPRWLVEQGRDDEALGVLKTVRSEDRAVAEWDQVERVVEEEHEEHWEGLGAILRSKWLIRILLVGIGISMTQPVRPSSKE